MNTITLSDCRILAIARYSTFYGLSAKTKVVKAPELIAYYVINRIGFIKHTNPNLSAVFSNTPTIEPVVKELPVNAVRYQFKNGKIFYVRAAYDPDDDTLIVVEAH